MKKRISSIAMGCLLAVGAAGCGSGNEPLSILGDPTSTPALSLPFSVGVSTGQLTINSVSRYSASNNGFDFNILGPLAAAGAILAPANGVVTAIDAASVTIYHNAHLTTQLTKLASVTVRVGDFVSQGSQVGTSTTVTGPAVHLTAILDGAVVCPYTLLTTDAKAKFNAALFNLGAQTPCD